MFLIWSLLNVANRFERGKLPPYTIPNSFDRLGTRIIGLNEIVGGEAPPAYSLPIGTLVWDYSLTAKTSSDNLLPLDGAAISRSTYASLFSVIGVTYGVGDGLTTFNVPSCFNLYSRVFGPSTGALGTRSPAILPLHAHTITTPANGGCSYIYAATDANGEFRNPGGIDALRFNTGSTSASFRSELQPNVSTRFTGYINTSVVNLEIGQMIYGLSDELLNYGGGKFLKCDGASFDPGVYGALASLLSSTFAPDLRGIFPVVKNFTPSVRTQDFGSNTLPTHSHSSPVAFTGLLKAGMFYPPAPGRQRAQGPGPGPGTFPFAVDSEVNSSTYTLGVGTDNRPANVALDFLICAK